MKSLGFLFLKILLSKFLIVFFQLNELFDQEKFPCAKNFLMNSYQQSSFQKQCSVAKDDVIINFIFLLTVFITFTYIRKIMDCNILNFLQTHTHNYIQFYRQKIQLMKQRTHDPCAKLKTQLNGLSKKPTKKVKKAEQTRTFVINKTKGTSEGTQRESFEDVIGKFKKLFDQRVAFVKDQYQPNTERPRNKKITQKPKKKFNQLFSTIEYKLNQHLPKSKTVREENTQSKIKQSKILPLQKSKSKSRQKSRGKSGKKYSAFGNKKGKKTKDKEILDVKRINTIYSQQKSTLKRTFQDVSQDENERNRGSVIVYNLDDDDLYFERVCSQRERKVLQVATKYLLGFQTHNSYEKYYHIIQQNIKQTQKQPIDQSLSKLQQIEESSETKNHISVEQMKQEEESKWLSFMEGLTKIKKDEHITIGLDSMIEEAKKNYLALKSMRVIDLAGSKRSNIPINHFKKSTSEEVQQESHHFSQTPRQTQSPLKITPKPKKHNYDYEAPLQIQRIFNEKRRSIEELCRQSEIRTKQMSEKKLKEDIDLMEFMSNNSNDSECLSSTKRMKLFSSEIEQKEKKVNFKKKDIIRKSEDDLFKSEEIEQNKKNSEGSQTFLLGNYSPEKQQHKKKYENTFFIQTQPLEINSKREIQQQKEWRIKKYEMTKDKSHQTDPQYTDLQQLPPPVTPENKTGYNFHTFEKAQKEISYSEEQVPIEQLYSDKMGQAFIRTKPIKPHPEQYFQVLMEELVEEFVLQMPPSMKTIVLQLLQPIIEIEGNPFSQEPPIQCSESTVLLTAHDMLEYMKKLPNEELLKRITTPLGLRSQEMLAVLRKIKYGDDEGSEMQESNYHSVIDLEHIYDFQIKQNPTNNDFTGYQQYFNQSIFDTMNVILDEMRPFGKHGYPPICFQTHFQYPPLTKIYNYVMSSLKSINRIKLGLMHFQMDSQIVIKQSLQLFTNDIVKDLQEEWLWMKEGQFEVYLQIMAQCEDLIFIQQVQHCRRVMQKKQLLS